VTKSIMGRFGVSRPTAISWIQKLARQGLVEVSGKTKAREYNLKDLFAVRFQCKIVDGLEEDKIWRDHVAPSLGTYHPEVVNNANYVFTEMVNNAIDHSESEELFIFGGGNACELKFRIVDRGIGIFRKICDHYDLEDERHAVLELSKGKLTTDPSNHSGEGIFFSSRVSRVFEVHSGSNLFTRKETRNDWIIETSEAHGGTAVGFVVDAMSPRPIGKVFSKFQDEAEYGFAKTHVPVHLAQFANEGLVSRSQAKRLLARFDKFEEVHLNFDGIKTIGQGFSDQIFRVFQGNHPKVHIYWTNACAEVEAMIFHAIGGRRNARPWEDQVKGKLNKDAGDWHLS